MRLRSFGVAAIAAGCLLSSVVTLAAVPNAPSASGRSTDHLVPQTSKFASTDLARFETNMGPLANNGSRDSGRLQLAAAMPLVGNGTVSGHTQAAVAAASFTSSPPDQAPSAWLMGGVTLLLIGYQLRRKHRLLRPHRFHQV
jgi:hypothetical protein